MMMMVPVLHLVLSLSPIVQRGGVHLRPQTRKEGEAGAKPLVALRCVTMYLRAHSKAEATRPFCIRKLPSVRDS